MQLHDRYGIVVTIVVAVGALAATAALLRPQWLPAVRAYLRLTLVAVALQVVIGLVLVVTGRAPSQGIHWFYGAATLVAMPIAGFIGRGTGGQEALWVMGGAVAALLFAFRAIGTG